MKIHIIFTLILLLSFSCKIDRKRSEYKKIEELVMYWNNRKVIIPDSLKSLSEDKSLIQNFLKDTSDCKIITIISGDCQMCIQEIRNWIPFFDKMKKSQISNKLYFIIENTNLSYFEKIYADDLPVGFNFFIDESGKLSEINHLPKDKNYKTVLLDKNNKVLLIGSPLSSDDMCSLFLERLKTKLN
jgi:hypothetical protein